MLPASVTMCVLKRKGEDTSFFTMTLVYMRAYTHVACQGGVKGLKENFWVMCHIWDQYQLLIWVKTVKICFEK